MRNVVMLVAVGVVLAACSDGPTGPSPTTVTSVIVSAPSPSLQVGATMTATAKLLNSKGDEVSSKTPKWSTSSPNVATVDQNRPFRRIVQTHQQADDRRLAGP